MKNIPVFTIMASLLIGGVFTILLASSTSWQPVTSCEKFGSSVQTGGCVAMEYGYPLRFISSDIKIDSTDVVSATLEVNKKSLLFDWALLSGAVAAGIVIASSQTKSRRVKRRTKRK